MSHALKEIIKKWQREEEGAGAAKQRGNVVIMELILT